MRLRTETFQAGHVRAFEFFGGVPTRISYDNTTIAVKKVIGAGAGDDPGVLCPWRATICSPITSAGSGAATRRASWRTWSATGGATSWSRSRFGSFAELNEHLVAACTADLHRRVRGKADNKIDRLETDRAAMLPLPAEQFEPRRVVQRPAQLVVAGALRPQRLLGPDRLGAP